MERDLERDERDLRRPDAVAIRPLERPPESARDGRDILDATREHALLPLRGSIYRISPSELGTLYDIGRFRTVAIADLLQHRHHDRVDMLRRELQALATQGLLQTRTIWNGPRIKALPVIALTRTGQDLVNRHGPREAGQAVYARLVKPAEVRHDAALYRMFQAERERIERAGGRIHRVILDYELKRRVYSPLAKARTLPAEVYAKRQLEVAAQNGLRVIDGKIPLPDLRLEYETAAGESAQVDLELATGHYHGAAMAAKARAGFSFYAADGSAARLSRMLEERDITVAILSL